MDSFFILVANNVDPDEMRHFVLVFTVCQTTHLCPNSINGSSIIFFEKKIFVCSYNTVLISYPPKSVLLSIYFNNVCMREVKSRICGGSNPSRLAFAIKIINS